MPLSRGLPDPGTEPGFPALQANSLLSEPQRSLELILFLNTYTDGFLPQGELLHFSVVYLYSRSQDLSVLTMALGLSETVSGSTVFLPTEFGRRALPKITLGMQESSFSVK